MKQWIKLHRASDGDEILVNLDNVAQLSRDNEGTIVNYCNPDDYIVVEESTWQIEYMMSRDGINIIEGVCK